MGDKWDYHQRKVDIAWEIVRKRLDATGEWSSAKSEENFQNHVRKMLKGAWEIVNDTLPTCDGN